MDSKIISGFDLSQKIKEVVSEDNVFVISDSNVAIIYGSLFSGVNHYIVPAGEDSKSLELFRQGGARYAGVRL